MSQSGVYEENVNPSAQPVLFVVGNDDVPVPPDPATGDINIIGASGISTSGNAGTYTLTITGSSTGATINGDSGSIAGPDITIYADQAALNCGSSVAFANSGTISTLNLSDANENTILGQYSGVVGTPGSVNTGIGTYVFSNLGNSADNVAVGYGALYALTVGNENTAIGSQSLEDLTTGNYNTAVGIGTLEDIISGNYNIALGYYSAYEYDSAESNNIIINNYGVSGENNTLRIGGGTGTDTLELQAAYISGIDGVNLNTANVVVEASDQLGTAVLTAGTGISITPSANAITITATGSGAFTWVNVSTDITLAPNTGYVSNFDEEIIFTLPTSANFGDYYRIVGNSSNGWALNINAGQYIQYGDVTAVSQLASAFQGDCIELLCVVPNTGFQVISNMGNIGYS